MSVPLACPNCGNAERLGEDTMVPFHYYATYCLVNGERVPEHSGDRKEYEGDEPTGVSCRECGWEGKDADLLMPDQVEAKRERGEL